MLSLARGRAGLSVCGTGLGWSGEARATLVVFVSASPCPVELLLAVPSAFWTQFH